MSRDIDVMDVINSLVPVLNMVPEHSDLTYFEIREIDGHSYAVPIYGEDIPQIGIVHGEGAFIRLRGEKTIDLIREIVNGI